MPFATWARVARPSNCRIARYCYRRSIYARAVGSRFFQFRRRSNGRPGDHAGLCIIPYPALASPPRCDHAVIRCHQRWHRDHARSGVEPSGFEPRPANPMVALVRLTANRNVMGEFANTQLTNAVAVAATAFVSALNAILLLGKPAYGSRSLAAEYSRGYCQGHPAARLKPVAVAAHRARRPDHRPMSTISCCRQLRHSVRCRCSPRFPLREVARGGATRHCPLRTMLGSAIAGSPHWVKDGPILSQARSRSKGPLSDQVADATKPRGQCRSWVASGRSR